MLKKLVNEACFTLKITTTGPLLVRSSHATISGASMTPVLTRRESEWEVYLPGSSLKGVVRSHLEKISRTLSQGVVCNPFQKVGEPDTSCSAALQQRKSRDEEITSEIAYRDACPICRLFGSTHFIGRLSINDAYLVDRNKLNVTELRDGVGIDRFTGGSYPGALFDLEAVSTDVEFETNIYLRNFETWQLGMVMLIVQDMEDGLVRIGSGRSRGLGSVKGEVNKLVLNHVTAGAIPAKQIWGMGKFLGDGSYGTDATDILELKKSPEPTRRSIRQQQCFDTEESLEELSAKSIQRFVDYIGGQGQ